MVFVNLHPDELLDEHLYDPSSPLADRASSVVLEITERERLELIDDLPRRVGALRRLGFRIAIDDMGAGYAGLSSFARLQPEFAKIDMSLVRDIDRNAVRQRVVGTMTSLCRELGIAVIAEGVENEAEARTLTEIGCDLLQGFHLGRPDPKIPPAL
jgi:EAL domain-containing protein (putative c-di-GMP-specific phosphodiesterase class I)